jgi:hypothetical protein
VHCEENADLTNTPKALKILGKRCLVLDVSSRPISVPRPYPPLSRANIVANRLYVYDRTAMRSLIIPSFFSTAAWAFATYDYVIVGGGLTGLVVANRLTENPSSTLTALIFRHSKINLN